MGDRNLSLNDCNYNDKDSVMTVNTYLLTIPFIKEEGFKSNF